MNKVKAIMNSEREYESQRPIIKEYILFLQNIIEKEPSNIKAICQLAISYFEDRRDTDICIEIMEAALTKNEESMSEQMLCELLNNLAYFYDEELGESDKAVETLNRAIKHQSCKPNSYYALAYLLVEDEPELALKVISEMSMPESPLNHYQYLKGYILMKNELYTDALRIFEELRLYSDNSEVREKSLYSSAIIRSITNETDMALRIADKLYDGFIVDHNEKVLTFELIHLYFLLRKFDKVVELFKIGKEPIYIDVEVIESYFYALKSLGLKSECEILYLQKIEEINEEIADTKLDCDFSNEEKESYINRSNEEIAKLKKSYSEIVLGNKFVQINDVFYSCKGTKCCYLIDCPRHS
ncbi:tetratricopeptide repeat protein [Fusibacter sp. JL216-2]|uniref:tetratricopeptide repeat protein n=1 Tax=Fusibacter sp. JL216-2 TaxID=3071453 RepID=UPI003D33DD74